MDFVGKVISRVFNTRPTRPFRTNTKKNVLCIIGDWNAKVGSQETPGVTGKFGLRVQKQGKG